MGFKTALGIGAILIGFLSYPPYLRDVFKGKTKPHVFSWFVWSMLEGIAFFAQMAKGGGSGAWVTGFSALMCLGIAILALFRGEKDITKGDWASFAGALAGVVWWQVTSDPLGAVILVTGVDLLAFAPTFRKAYRKPKEETWIAFALAALKFTLGLAALESFNWTTALYPASLILSNSLFVAMVLWRRAVLVSEKI